MKQNVSCEKYKSNRLDFFLNFLDFTLFEKPLKSRLGIKLKGAFADDDYKNSTNFLQISIDLLTNTSGFMEYKENVTNTAIAYLTDEPTIDLVPESRQTFLFDVDDKIYKQIYNENAQLRVCMRTNFVNTSLPIQFAYDPSPIDKSMGIIYAALLLIGLYVLIIWEVVHRTFAAMLASTMSIAILAAMDERPTMPEIIGWIDIETVLLLFGLMIMFAILSETGIFDYMAVYAYKVSDGKKIVGTP